MAPRNAKSTGVSVLLKLFTLYNLKRFHDLFFTRFLKSFTFLDCLQNKFNPLPAY